MRRVALRGPRAVVLAGSALMVLAMYLPWFEAANLDEFRTIQPGTVHYLVPVTVLTVLLVVGGMILLVTLNSPVLLGSVSALYLNVTSLFWSLGSKTSSWFPKQVLPGNFTIRIDIGMSVALVGGLFALVGCVLVLVEQTWDGSSEYISGWRLPSGLLLAVLLIALRELSWFKLDSSTFVWSLTSDVVPFLGDSLMFVMLIGAAACVAAALMARRWLMMLVVIAGALIVVLSAIGLAASEAIASLGSWITDDAKFLDEGSVRLTATYGPVFTLLLGGLLICFGLTSWYRPAENTEPPVLDDPGFDEPF